MIGVDTNVLIYACDRADPRRQQIALDLVTNAEDGVLLWQVACEFISASRKLSKQGFTSTHAWNRLAEFRTLPAGAEFNLTTLAPDRLVLGDPDTCVREFQRWRDATGASTFLLRLRHAHSGGPPHEKILEAIRLFGERVLPYV